MREVNTTTVIKIKVSKGEEKAFREEFVFNDKLTYSKLYDLSLACVRFIEEVTEIHKIRDYTIDEFNHGEKHPVKIYDFNINDLFIKTYVTENVVIINEDDIKTL